MHLHLNHTCGPDNELVQLPVLYNSLEGVAEEWYLDFILHARKSWAFEKAVHSLFLTYTFGLTANPAVRESTEVRYSRMESRHEYAQCWKVKAQWLAQEPDESRMVVQSLFPEEEEAAVLKCQGIFQHNENGQANQLHPQVTGGSSWGKTAKHPLISDSHQVSYCVHLRPPHSQQGLAKMEGRIHSSTGSADSTINHTLRLCLQGQVLGNTLEMENFRFQGELNDLRERMHRDHQPDGEHPVAAPLSPGNTGQSRSLAERIDGLPWQPPTHISANDRGRTITVRRDSSLPPTVVVHPINFHSRFLPLGTHFQEGGMGGLIFSRPQDWPSAIHENTSARPRGIRRWGPQPVHLDDLHVHLLIGQIIYGGNRPPGRHDPVDPQRPQKAIEADFFRGTVGIVLELGTFRMTYD